MSANGTLDNSLFSSPSQHHRLHDVRRAVAVSQVRVPPERTVCTPMASMGRWRTEGCYFFLSDVVLFLGGFHGIDEVRGFFLVPPGPLVTFPLYFGLTEILTFATCAHPSCICTSLEYQPKSVSCTFSIHALAETALTVEGMMKSCVINSRSPGSI